MNIYPTFSDAELAGLLKQGDHQAYEEIYHRYKGVLHLHAYKKLSDFEEAKDVVQELFSVLWDKHSTMPAITNLSGYLYQMMRNRIFDLIAHQKVAFDHLASIKNFLQQGEAITDHLVRERELANRIENEINALPPKMREVFILSRKKHLSHKEIAEALGISEATVKNHVKGALKILRVRLGLFVFITSIIFAKVL